MFCPQCGARNADQSAFCFQCGHALQREDPPQPHQPQAEHPPADNPYQPPQSPQEKTPQEIPNYMAQAIVLTVLSGVMICCNCLSLLGLPFGIVAIVYANQVNTHLAAGDTARAWQASRNARTWCWVSFGIFLFSLLLGVVMIGLGVMTSFLQELR